MPVLKNPKHELFAQAVAKGISGPDAYIGAGYDVAPNVASPCASRLLTNAKIQARLAEIQQRGADKAVKAVALSREWVLTRLMKHADVCLGDIKIKAVRAVKSRLKDETGGFTDVVATTEIEITERDAAAANRALELLGREHGMFVEHKEIGKPGDFDNLTDDELERQYSDIASEVGISHANGKGIAAAKKPRSLH